MSQPPRGPAARARLDRQILARGLAATGEKARALIMTGRVRVDGRPCTKPGTAVRGDAAIEVLPPERQYVGRGGDKLAGAIAALGVVVAGRTALDLGASTGGFTDCLLQGGARRVVAVDVGRGLLDPKLRADPRVVVIEGRNARSLVPADVGGPADLVCADLAFISLRLVLPAVAPLVAPGGEALLLVKPQFELGRGEVGRGVVRDPAKHARAIREVAAAARSVGLEALGVAASAVRGARGNREFFLWLSRLGSGDGERLEQWIAVATGPS